MGQVRHGSATTTHAVRAAIQRSQASLAQLSRELGINPKTVAKWRKRATEWSHALRIHLQNLDIRARSIHPKSDPPDAGTEHLGAFAPCS
jgi:2,4-dienoyl-CoA reductase-like NADH-dependent reductase (Old Yellow Enzyme family)